MSITEIHVERGNIRNIKAHTGDAQPLADGAARLQIEGFALTANNVTYAATGEVIGYWKFFPTDDPATGIVPVWGFARVIESRSAHLEVGQRLYGFFPMASHLDITPEPRGANVVIDAAPHRRDLPPVYNAYTRAGASDAADDALKSIFYPLLLTSYLLFDFLKDNDWFKAEQIIISSASSKTGLGLCKYLAEARPDGPRVIGLTSKGNRAFVQGLDACDQIATYGAFEQEIAQIPSVYVDMAGNADIRGRLHHHLGENMLHSAAVGTSHWDKFEPTGDLPGARPRFFFAPSQVEKRRADWGPGQIEKRLEGAWRRVAQDSLDWMKIEISQGLSSAIPIYTEIANGKTTPDTGHYIEL
ncbi:MAG: DUF2855 family protein [Alphaproteobacteria bacterium]|nr:DUF2855 family protein [Alphaproteobacteria bacterium]